MMLRSPQPAPRRVEKIVQMDGEEVDMLKYLGTTLDHQQEGGDGIDGGTMMRKSMSMNNLH